ncbi:MAG: histidine phosphatase family protein [Planctomycetota bacterium]|nr:histidine phosphatase family protein [Planctomycetota bacterium]MCX8039064.1 histidine phosphatase family protein [Planctomycetota bacterium]MDW8373781.1 histidine phosphatase family protein [Planctomycetota bacterium]
MHLALVRHGRAVDREDWDGDDADRPLTREGQAEVRSIARLLAPLISAQQIWTSPWARALRTAELLAEQWQLPLLVQDWLAGEETDPEDWLPHLRGQGDLVLVGHEPDLGQVLGLLLGVEAAIPLKKGAIALLEGTPKPGDMRLRLLLAPAEARVLAAS